MELKIVVTPKLLEEAIISLMENKFNVKVSEATIIISESCNFTDNSGATVNLTIGEKPINYPVNRLLTADEVWRKKAARYIAEEQEELPRFMAQNPEGLNAQKYASTTNPL